MTSSHQHSNTTLNKFLESHYKHGARGEGGYYDCWGLVRAARTELFGRELVADVANSKATESIKGRDKQYRDMHEAFERVERQKGAIVAIKKRGIFIHVALMIERDKVLEIKREGDKARIINYNNFIKEYPLPMWSVEFYD